MLCQVRLIWGPEMLYSRPELSTYYILHPYCQLYQILWLEGRSQMGTWRIEASLRQLHHIKDPSCQLYYTLSDVIIIFSLLSYSRPKLVNFILLVLGGQITNGDVADPSKPWLPLLRLSPQLSTALRSRPRLSPYINQDWKGGLQMATLQTQASLG